MPLNAINHPLIAHKIALLRQQGISTKQFRELANEVASLLTYEATRDLPLENREINGWQGEPINTQMLSGKMPLVPNAAFPMVDVRELAELHVKAMTANNVVGKRIIAASAEPRGFATVAKILKDYGYSGPSTRLAPNFMLKFAALFDREAKGMIGLLDMSLHADNRLAKKVLQWQPMSFDQSVLDTADKVAVIQGL